MCYFDVILLSDVISSIGPSILYADTYVYEAFEKRVNVVYVVNM